MPVRHSHGYEVARVAYDGENLSIDCFGQNVSGKAVLLDMERELEIDSLLTSATQGGYKTYSACRDTATLKLTFAVSGMELSQMDETTITEEIMKALTMASEAMDKRKKGSK